MSRKSARVPRADGYRVVVAGSLGQRLRGARRRRFVGRAGELELFRRMLVGDQEPCRVLFLHGPGGVGKTALLEALAEVAQADGASPVRLDARLIGPSTAGLWEAVDRDGCGPLAGLSRPVLLLDTFELLGPIEEWVRGEFLPALPGDTAVVIAGRAPPGPRWTADPAWSEVMRTVSLRNLPPTDVRTYLHSAAVPGGLHERLRELSHGHPLTLALLVDAVRRSGDALPDSLAEVPDLVGTLLAHVLDEAPTRRHRHALEACAHLKFTTEDLLRAVLPGDDPAELFGWLRTLSFVDEGPRGLFPHDLARDVLDADLRWRDPDGYADLHRRGRAQLLERIPRAADTRERQRRVADAMFVARTHPAMSGSFEHPGTGPEHIDRVRDRDVAQIVAMTRHHQGPEQAELVQYWLQRQPNAFGVFRGAGGEVLGYGARLALHAITDADLQADPGARAMWDYAHRHAPPRPGEEMHAWRFFVDREYHQEPSVSRSLIAVWSIQEILSAARCSWDFVGSYEDGDRWVAAVMAYADFARAPEADYEIGERRYTVFAHDWRRLGVAEWLDLTAERELGGSPEPPPAPAPELVLSQPDFAAAVRDALRDLHAPDRMAHNPLRDSRLVRDRAGGRPASEALHELLIEAAQTLRTNPRERGMYDLVDRTFLRPAATQEHAAHALHLSFSTYRRHRDRAVARIVEQLWHREIYGPDPNGHPMASDRPVR